MSVDFDPKTLRTSGTPAVAVTDVVAQPGTGGSFFAVAGDGSVAYLRGKPDFFATRVITRRADGTSATLAVPLRTYANPRLSHDGSRLAVQVVSANDDVWIFHRERGTFTRVTAQAENLFPQWSPDDKTFLVTMFLNSAMPVLATVPITGTLKPQALAPDGPPVQIGTSWSASGRIAYTGMGGPERTADVFVIDRPGAASRPIIQTRFEEHESSLSPDGRWIVYTSDESGTAEIYLRAVDAPAEKLQLSISGGSEPLWSRDGKRIFFRSGTAFHAVDVTMGTVAPSAGAPHRLFEGDYLYGSEAQGYDVGPDGTFVLLQRNGSAQDGGRLHILFK
jgi:Tol biopolymer transport system component